jgi:subtilisin family serine protease
MKITNILTIMALTASLCAMEFYTPPKANKFSQRAEQFINSGTKETRGFVIYFTDKNIFDQKGYDTAKSEVDINEKTLRRRAKTFKRENELLLFSDLPVYEEYIEKLGLGKMRARSKWFNFVSAEISAEKAVEIAGQPFVKRIDILPKVKRDLRLKDDLKDKGQNAKDAFYGNSYNQSNQINVPAAHALGYKGQGTRLLIIDTGYNKDHQAFDSLTVVDEWDFIFNDGETANDGNDVTDQEGHGTACWSIAAGYKIGKLVGPAHKADFLLAKTENYVSETTLEEDYMVAALEWGEALGADVASISLGYSTFDNPADNYTYADMDGETAICTLGAKRAAYLGVVVCNSMGNSGNDSWKYLSAPADADSIISVGAVDSLGVIASFSSYGPSYDGRIKPEVVARGVYDLYARATTDTGYSRGNGTSFSTPLVAGAVCMILSAHPDWTNMDVREALMMTADRSSVPDSTRYGWGLIDVLAAIYYVHLSDPKNVTTSVSGTTLTVSWDAVTNARSYLIYHSDLPYEGFAYLGTTDQTSYPVNVTSATKKFYYIKASNQEMK